MSSPSVIALAEPTAESGGTPAPSAAPSAPAEAETARAPQAEARAPQAQLAKKRLKRREKKRRRHDKRAHRHKKSTHRRHKSHRRVRAIHPRHLSRAAVERTGGTPAAVLAGKPRRNRRAPSATPSAPPGFAGETPIVSADPDDWGTIAGGEALLGSTPVVLPAGLSSQLAQPPAFLVPIYKQAGSRYGVPWRVLAAINSIETDYGRDLGVSSAGALGWMQFMPGTWQLYGQGGNPYDPRDAIFAAARLLDAAGASHDLRGAIFAYNDASWYVAAVLWRASTISTGRAHVADNRDGYALPLDARYMHALGRTDDGVDIETAPDGAAVYSMTRGVVTTVASDPNGFGPNYPVVLATSGPLAGQFIYYGHVAASVVRPGEQVLAGQPIAIVGHTGDANGLGHGHIEIGFCDSSGDPLSHHGAMAWTPSGQLMRSVLQSLSAKFDIANS
jgi:murein DD-endopeptidase MepM/ murein hydrolase activator NlpD